MVGPSAGWPIVLAPFNDQLGLIVCEGIETGLSLAEATGCGVWAAGAAGRMPALADRIPDWTDFITIAAEGDDAGRRGAGSCGAASRTRAALRFAPPRRSQGGRVMALDANDIARERGVDGLRTVWDAAHQRLPDIVPMPDGQTVTASAEIVAAQ